MHIVVITHAQDHLFRKTGERGMASDYLLGPIVGELGGPLGHKVTVHRGLPDKPIPADLAIMHVDLTRVPDDYVAFGATFPHCINLRAADISKRAVSDALLGPDEAWDGPVIVKSNWNFGGSR